MYLILSDDAIKDAQLILEKFLSVVHSGNDTLIIYLIYGNLTYRIKIKMFEDKKIIIYPGGRKQKNTRKLIKELRDMVELISFL